MVDKQRAFAALLVQGVSISEACRRLGVDRKTGHWWKNGRRVERDGVLVTVMQPVVGRRPATLVLGRFLGEDERVVSADRVREGRSARAIAAELGRAVSTVARELKRNASPDGGYRPHASAGPGGRSTRPAPAPPVRTGGAAAHRGPGAA